ncbi:MAG: hypothetical protein HY421_03165 [Candidatus Kerfeldbacteria bacterium]|nr:hypothetical protein [Candidatus Kerfeldbacteria bacterium]
MEGEASRETPTVLRREQVTDLDGLVSAIRSMLSEAASKTLEPGARLFEIAFRGASGATVEYVMILEQAEQISRAWWSAGEDRTLEARTSQVLDLLRQRGLPFGNPHPIEATLELREVSE